MTQQTINLGAAANDGTGDTLRIAGAKINANFDDTYGAIAALQAALGIPTGIVPVAWGGTGGATAADARTNLGVVAKAGDAMGGNLTIAAPSPAYVLNASAAGQNRALIGSTNTAYRWFLLPGTSEAEAGGNAGSNFAINRYSDAGDYLGTPLLISRATGVTNLEAHPTVGGASFACRAWVNFNGTGTVAIRSSANVTSVTDHGVGDFTVNFTTAMPDTNYATNASGDGPVNTQHCHAFIACGSVRSTYTASAVSVAFFNAANNALRADPTIASVSVFR